MTKKLSSALSALMRWRFFPALLIVLAIIVGMLLPTAVLAVQGAHLEKSDTLISTGISSGRQSSETAKLDILSRFYSTVLNGSAEEVALSRGRFMTAEQVDAVLPEFEKIINSAGLAYSAPPAYAEKEITPYLMVLDDGTDMTSAIIWIAHYFWEKNELCYIVDDETGIILSGYEFSYTYYDGEIGIAEQPYSAADDDGALLATAQRFADALCVSYGFDTVTAEAAPEDGYHSYSITFVHDGEPVCSIGITFETVGWHFSI